MEYDRAIGEWAAAKKLRVWGTQSTNLLPVFGHSTEINTPSFESYPGTVRNVWATALHLSMDVNTAKLIYSLLHYMDTILKRHLNGCVQCSERIYSSHLMTHANQRTVREYSPKG